MNPNPGKAVLPKVVPRLNSVLNSFRFTRNPIPILQDLVKEYGQTFILYLGGVEKSIVTVDPVVIQHILQKNHRNYHKSPLQSEKLARFVGNGLLTSNGEYWLQQRRLIQPGFHREKLAGLISTMSSVIDHFIVGFNKEHDHFESVDLHVKMMELAFRIVAKSLFGAHLPEEELQMLRTNINEIQSFFIKYVRQPYLIPYFKITGRLNEMEKLALHSYGIIQSTIDDRRKNKGSYDDLLQMLLDARYEDTGLGMSDKQLLDESLILFVAGHETTANALTWTWYLLSQHRDVYEKVRREANSVLVDGMPDAQMVRQLTYTRQVIEESMRLYPPAWITDRIALEEDSVNGLLIPKGITIAAFIYGVHHNSLFWDNPDEFNPDRFNIDNKRMHQSYTYLPFGGGPRMCIGNNFAMMEMQLVIAKLALNYEFHLLQNQDVFMNPMITLSPGEGIQFKVVKRC